MDAHMKVTQVNHAIKVLLTWLTIPAILMFSMYCGMILGFMLGNVYEPLAIMAGVILWIVVILALMVVCFLCFARLIWYEDDKAIFGIITARQIIAALIIVLIMWFQTKVEYP
jgi:hypothetical protein